MQNPGTRIDTMRIDPAGPVSDDLSFRSDAVMPAQFYPVRRGSASVEPIMRLMAGILIDAVRCFQNNFEARHPSRRQEFRKLGSGFSTTGKPDPSLSGPCATRWRSIPVACEIGLCAGRKKDAPVRGSARFVAPRSTLPSECNRGAETITGSDRSDASRIAKTILRGKAARSVEADLV